MPDYPPPDEFLKLCAVSVSGQLRPDEHKRLEEHLAECPSCREAMHQYETLAGEVLPQMVPEFLGDSQAQESTWSESRAEADLMARLERDKQGVSGPYSITSSGRTETWRPLGYAVAALVLITVGIAAYRLGERQGYRATVDNRTKSSLTQTVTPPPPNNSEQKNLKAEVANRENAIAELRHQLAQQAAVIVQLTKRQSELQGQLQQGSANSEALTQQRVDLMAQLDAAHISSDRLQQDLQALSSKTLAGATENQDLKKEVAVLQAQLGEQQDTIEQQQELLAHDRDIRELMGARDLYIAEVYDVAREGKTKKPFGRLFYTKGKSLIFYAYDLDQQKGLKNAATFQAWGRRGPNWKQATNLGVFYEDNSAKKRWVLRFDDPKKLAEIDAVFVTVEPNGGSSKPSGKPLLFAYLKIDSNHP